MKNFLIGGAVAVAALLMAAAPAAAADTGNGANSYRLDVVGTVPVICRVKVDNEVIAPTAGTVSLGTLHEFCNNSGGYRVVADYSPALVNARLKVDGAVIVLGQSGSAVVSQSDQPGIVNRAVEIELADASQVGSVSFRIEPR